MAEAEEVEAALRRVEELDRELAGARATLAYLGGAGGRPPLRTLDDLLDALCDAARALVAESPRDPVLASAALALGRILLLALSDGLPGREQRPALLEPLAGMTLPEPVRRLCEQIRRHLVEELR